MIRDFFGTLFFWIEKQMSWKTNEHTLQMRSSTDAHTFIPFFSDTFVWEITATCVITQNFEIYIELKFDWNLNFLKEIKVTIKSPELWIFLVNFLGFSKIFQYLSIVNLKLFKKHFLCRSYSSRSECWRPGNTCRFFYPSIFYFANYVCAGCLGPIQISERETRNDKRKSKFRLSFRLRLSFLVYKLGHSLIVSFIVQLFSFIVSPIQITS